MLCLTLDLSDPGSGPSFLRLDLQGSFKVCFMAPALPWLFFFSIEGSFDILVSPFVEMGIAQSRFLVLVLGKFCHLQHTRRSDRIMIGLNATKQ